MGVRENDHGPMELTPLQPTRPLVNSSGRLTVKINEAAAMLGVSTQSIRRAIERGDIRVNRKLRHVLIPWSEVERFAAA